MFWSDNWNVYVLTFVSSTYLYWCCVTASLCNSFFKLSLGFHHVFFIIITFSQSLLLIAILYFYYLAENELLKKIIFIFILFLLIWNVLGAMYLKSEKFKHIDIIFELMFCIEFINVLSKLVFQHKKSGF